MDLIRVPVDRLAPGLFVRLRLGWMAHPFLRSAFLLKNERQCEVIRGLGLKAVDVDPALSDPDVLRHLDEAPNIRPRAAEVSRNDEPDPLWAEKQRRIEQARLYRKDLRACEKQFQTSLRQVRALMTTMKHSPIQAASQAEDLVEDLMPAFTDQADFLLHLMNTSAVDDTLYYHSLNVTILSLLLGAAAGVAREDLVLLGLGAVLHDVGKIRIPDRVLLKKTPWTTAERKLYELHPRYGREIMAKLESFPGDALAVIEQHHESLNGKGYPAGIGAAELGTPARIVAIANRYDDLCNARGTGQAMTPADALSFMYSREADAYDRELLQVFIKQMGVYPPGTVVCLNDGRMGLVISIKQDDTLNPRIVVYDPDIPKDEAVILDLSQEADLEVRDTLVPQALDAAAFDYLSPRTRISYYAGGVP